MNKDIEKIKMEDLTDKQYFTTYELADAKWFPIKSASTILTLIDNGIIKAMNVSAIDGKNRYKISKEEVIRYLVELE